MQPIINSCLKGIKPGDALHWDSELAGNNLIAIATGTPYIINPYIVVMSMIPGQPATNSPKIISDSFHPCWLSRIVKAASREEKH